MTKNINHAFHIPNLAIGIFIFLAVAFQMSRSVVESNAFQELDLLKDVVAFKMKFYRCPWAKYEEAVPGTIKLIPPEKSFSELQDDYGRMKNMIYGSVPSFEQIMTGIRELEQEINQL